MAHAASSNPHHHNRNHLHNGAPTPPNGYTQPPAPPNTDDNPPSYPFHAPDIALSSSLLEPRIAVVLNVPKPWRPWLFACRLLSIFPAIFWALQPALTLLVQIIPVAVPGGKKAIPFPWTEMSLGLMWCGASAYLSFFFIDCLMSRWLINYTPQATIIRLLTINSTNAFLTERILTFSGGFEDPRLLLPGWVTIATRSINIQKETSTSINIFSIASFISMISLLAHLHYNGSDYPQKPFESLARLLFEQARRLTGEAVLPLYPPSHSEL
ncbi:hypothetical protein LX32DRAFT_710355 [Colletotrichum zoysiae]|uniref:N-glycosylation protein n=1 Tax=Colletotrichum zoysiae TaxID=1216348 RepID=A0AAD9H4M1_9PEZI|nr:hypothetical protein LX32DRAFT_710355 [Colletotrichum zoysiae]